MDRRANWDRHLGLTYSSPTPRGDGIAFSATGQDGSSYRFHLEMNALKALGAEAFYDADILERFEAHRPTSSGWPAAWSCSKCRLILSA